MGFARAGPTGVHHLGTIPNGAFSYDTSTMSGATCDMGEREMIPTWSYGGSFHENTKSHAGTLILGFTDDYQINIY